MPKKNTNKRSSDREDAGDAPKIKKSRQSSLLFGVGAVTKLAREFFYVGKEVLLTDEIYSGRVPDDMRGMLFCYMVTSYDVESKVFSLRYNKRMIGQEGVQWVHQDGGRETMPNVSLLTVKSGYVKFTTACTRINAFESAQVSVAKQVLKKEANDQDTNMIDYSDLDAAAESSEKGWRGQEVIEVDFELTGETG